MPHTTIETPRLLLRPPTLEDAEAIYHGYATDREVARYVLWTPHRSVKETRVFLRHFIDHGRSEDNYPWIIARRQGEIIGAMHLRVTPPRTELGFNLARPHWNRGFATEAVRAVVARALALPGIARVQAFCHVDNRASARVMEKAGMHCEGVLQQYMVFPNIGEDAQDVRLYARLEGDDAAQQD